MSDSKKEDASVSIDFLKLTPDTEDYLQNFQCGNPNIDRYFREEALNDENSSTYIFVDQNTDTLLACVSLCCTGIIFLSPSNFSIVEHTVPAYEIAYFATNQQFQGQLFNGSGITISEKIMHIVINFINSECCSLVNASKIVLYSVPEAVHFYEKCSFYSIESYMLRSNDPVVQNCIPMAFDLWRE